MTLVDIEWKDDILIFPAVKRAVAVLARATVWGYAAVALLWVLGAAAYAVAEMVAAGSAERVVYLDGPAMLAALQALLSAVLLPCLYLLMLWCHHVLLAGRGNAVTRWLLLVLLFFALLHPVCVAYSLATCRPLLVNQFLLPAVLNTVPFLCLVLNWFRMAAAPLRLRLQLLFFALAMTAGYLLSATLLVPLFDLLLFCLAWFPLRRLARYAPLIVSLPPKE